METTEESLNCQTSLVPRKSRESNLELFRIVLMLMIIAHHFIVHGIGYQSNIFTINNVIAVTLEPIGRMAVICFEIISGFFIYNFTFKLDKFVKLILEMVFYAMIWFAILALTKQVPYSTDFLKYSLMPFLYGNWFLTCYLLIYLASPLIKKAIVASTEKQLRLSVIVFYVLVNIVCFVARNTLIENWFTRPVLFVFWLFIGAWIQKGNYSINWKWRLAGIGAFVLGTAIRLALLYSNSVNSAQHDIDKYFSYYSPFLVVEATALFLEFKGFKIKESRIINGISGATLGIYLTHDNDYARKTIWHTLFKTENYVDSPYMILYLIGCTFLIFLVSLLIDFSRKHFLEHPLLGLIKVINDDGKNIG
jgi:surface polysaccharide O-acyltransferase-like enzyme